MFQQPPMPVIPPAALPAYHDLSSIIFLSALVLLALAGMFHSNRTSPSAATVPSPGTPGG